MNYPAGAKSREEEIKIYSVKETDKDFPLLISSRTERSRLEIDIEASIWGN